MQKRFKPVVLVALVFSLQCVSLKAITLEEAQNFALTNNNDLQTQKLNLQAAERAKNASWNAFLPSMSLTGGISNTHISEPATGKAWNWNASAGLSMSLSAGVPSKLKQISLAYDMAFTNYEREEQNLLTKVASSFYNLMAERQNIKILEDSRELSRIQYEQTRRNYNNGLASELSLLQSQYAYLSSGPALENAKTTYQASLDAFQTLIGSDEPVVPEDEIVLTKLDLPGVDELATAYMENRLDIRQKKLALAQAELAKTITSLDSLAPSINLSENIRLSPSSSISSQDKEVGMSGTFSVSVSIPLDGFIPGSAKNLNIKTLEDGITSAQIALETARIQAEQDIEANINTINQLWNSIEIAKLNLSIARRAYQLSTDGYNAGLVSQTDLEQSRQQMVSARQNVSKSETSYLIAVYNLANALNLSAQEVTRVFGRATD